MKKMFIIFLLGCIMVCTVACNESNTSLQNSSTEKTTKTLTDETIITVPNTTEYIKPVVDFEIFTPFDREEYNDYITTHEMPEWFIEYTYLSDLFPFKEFQFHDAVAFPEYKKYTYNSHDYSLKISHESSLFSRDVYEVADLQVISLSDYSLISCSNDAKLCIYNYDGIEYTYVRAKLSKIAWKCDNVYFALTTASDTSEPFDSNTSNMIVSGFFDKRTALSSFQWFEEMLETKAIDKMMLEN